LIKSNYFKLAKTADIFHEDRRNRITITSHFVKIATVFSALNYNRPNQAFLKRCAKALY